MEEAAKDLKVLAIKQTLYRTERLHHFMHALMHAAEEGKQVAVLVEIKARLTERIYFGHNNWKTGKFMSPTEFLG